MKHKIALCNGTMDLERKYVEYMAKLGSSKARELLKKKYTFDYGGWKGKGWTHFQPYNFSVRHDPYLIQMIEDMKPPGWRIETINENKYYIQAEDDGYEILQTPKTIEWNIISPLKIPSSPRRKADTYSS